MRPRPRRSSNAARPSSASGGCAIALSPTASRKPATACSPSHGCRQVSGEAREQRTRSSVCTKSSSGGSRRRPCCRRQKQQRCCSGRCSPLVRSTCARLMVGRRSPQSPSISRLTSPPARILSKGRRSRHRIPTPLATAPVGGYKHSGDIAFPIREYVTDLRLYSRRGGGVNVLEIGRKTQISRLGRQYGFLTDVIRTVCSEEHTDRSVLRQKLGEPFQPVRVQLRGARNDASHIGNSSGPRRDAGESDRFPAPARSRLFLRGQRRGGPAGRDNHIDSVVGIQSLGDTVQ